jgi:tRNA-intron lyase
MSSQDIELCESSVNSGLIPVSEGGEGRTTPVGVMINGGVWVIEDDSVQGLTREGSYGNVILRKLELKGTASPPVKKFHQDLPMKDHFTSSLYLMPVEAFYLLHHSLINIVKDDNSHITMGELMKDFTTNDPEFLIKYVAYHNLRVQGWIPKCGMKFGVNFLLYKGSPSLFHSTYSVIISNEGKTESTLCWQQIISLTRVNESVHKDLVVCTITVPPLEGSDDSDDAATRIKLTRLISSSNVKFTVVKRFVPERNRE